MASDETLPHAPEPDDTLQRGQPVGRFVVLGLLGRGGMGEVYAAYDPELDRKVAIKLLRNSISESHAGHALLLREAQATAKLQHPNVVVVYDVGTLDERVFIAMELVDGQTMRSWVRATHPSWREALKVFIEAGRGLAAAHEAGLVHRDFKPDNVMITRDGQVRVMDFGLARTVSPEAQASDAKPDPDDVATLSDDAPAAMPYLDVSLTRTGDRVGTPGYMPLEQFLPGAGVDARTDQFSFCVALYEVLYGERPFGTGDAKSLQLRVAIAKVQPAPADSGVPPWVRKILLRGLRPRREDRFPSMGELLAALADDPQARRRRWLTVAAVAALIPVAAWGAHHLGAASNRMCGGGGGRLAGSWEPAGVPSARKEEIHRAFTASGRPFADTAFAGVTRLLDQYAARWVSSYVDACEATHVRGEQSAEVLDLRMDCLRGRLGNLRALSDVLTHADGQVVENAVSAAAALPAIEPCADVPVLRSVIKPPEDPDKRRRVESAREELARFLALRDSGQCQRAAPSAAKLVTEADAIGYDPLRAEVLVGAGVLNESCGDSQLSIDLLKRAFEAATAGRADRVAVEAAAILPVPLMRIGQPGPARDWLAIGQAAFKRLGTSDILEAWLLVAEAEVVRKEHDLTRAVELNRQSLAMRVRILGPDHPEALVAMQNLGNTLADAGRLEEALIVDQDARALGLRVLGPAHPRFAMIANNMGEVLNALGRYPEARASFAVALTSFRSTGTDPILLTYALTGTGRALLGEGRASEAVAPLEQALALRLERHSVAAEIGETRFALARALWSRPDARPRAVTLATASRGELAGDARAVAAVDAWFAGAR